MHGYVASNNKTSDDHKNYFIDVTIVLDNNVETKNYRKETKYKSLKFR